jgi:crossover junction endodeoxyribonuclease RuvC
MMIIGIDPGLDGGIAWLAEDGTLTVHIMPTLPVGTKRALDEVGLAAVLAKTFDASTRHAWVELVGPMPKQGLVSTFSFGTGWGLVRGILVGLGIPYTLVRPQEWQRNVLAGLPQGSEAAVARRRWPQTEWRATERCRLPHSGMVDAALIALHGQRKEMGRDERQVAQS